MNTNFKNIVNDFLKKYIILSNYDESSKECKYLSLDKEVANINISYYVGKMTDDLENRIYEMLLSKLKDLHVVEFYAKNSIIKRLKLSYNGINITLILRFNSTTTFFIDITCVGKELNVIKEFDEYPEFKPYAILHKEYVYTSVINSFYKILKRSGNTIYFVELKNIQTSGNCFEGYEKPELNSDVDYTNVKRAKINKKGYVKIDNYTVAKPWDGFEKHFDLLD